MNFPSLLVACQKLGGVVPADEQPIPKPPPPEPVRVSTSLFSFVFAAFLSSAAIVPSFDCCSSAFVVLLAWLCVSSFDLTQEPIVINATAEEKFSVQLTAANFDALVMNGTAPWILKFFAPWCGHCKAMAADWNKAANHLEGGVRLGSIDCTVEKELAQRFNIRGFPTLKTFAGLNNHAASALANFTGGRTADVSRAPLSLRHLIIPMLALRAACLPLSFALPFRRS